MFISKNIVPFIAFVAGISKVIAKPACTFVEVGFVSKPCGNAPTNDELKKFFADQAANVTQLKAQRPCGFTTCPKLKRDLEFTYSPRALDVDTVKSDLPERSLPDRIEEGQSHPERSAVENEVSSPIKEKRDVKDDPDLETRNLDELTEDELIERNLPVMRGDDGVLRLYGRGVAFTPQQSDDIDELHERIKRGEVQSEAHLREREDVPKGVELEQRDWDITDEGDLIARNLPVASDGDGNLYLFGSR